MRAMWRLAKPPRIAAAPSSRVAQHPRRISGWTTWLSNACQGSIGVSFQGCTGQPALLADLSRRPAPLGLRG